MKHRAALAGAASALLLAVSSSGAAEIEGVRFADELSVGGDTLRLNGVGLLRYRVLFRAYVAALYLGSGPDPADVPRRLEIEYFWSIGARDFGEAADALLARSLDDAALGRLRERLDRLHAGYEDIEPGDRYSLTYRPGIGTELAKNGRRIEVIPGRDFAEAYFGIWLGDDPLDEKLRDDLLGAG